MDLIVGVMLLDLFWLNFLLNVYEIKSKKEWAVFHKYRMHHRHTLKKD